MKQFTVFNMPSITREIDLSKGIRIPIRVTGPQASVRTMAVFSLTSLECQISSALAKRMKLPTLGRYTVPTIFASRQKKSDIAYQIELEVIKGGLGMPIDRYPLQRVKATESDLDNGIGIVLGLQILQRGLFTLNPQSFSFSF
ncbi:MAG: hypothetical protein KZQ99_04575 [Candidatus Thiodiazotropha sp. (ex Dulcina madagascariensis)]|nr:hypothetical protein [Candidatus Thiodiazotropha sp. (ex Dulcina madagascariensis)]